MSSLVAAYADERVIDDGHWYFETAPDELRTIHHVAGGQFYAVSNSVQG